MPIVPTADYEAYLGLSSGDVTVALVETEIERVVKQFIDWDPIQTDHLAYLPPTEAGGNGDPFVHSIGNIPNVGGRTNILSLPHKYVRAACGHGDAVDGELTVWRSAGAYAGQVTAFEDDHLLTRGTHYVIDFDHHYAANAVDLSRTGHLRLLGGSWPRQRGSVKVVFTAGFSATEFTGALSGGTDAWDASDIRHACLMTMAAAYHTVQTTLASSESAGGALSGEAIEGYSYTRNADGAAALAVSGMSIELPPGAASRLARYRRMGGLIA